MQGKKMHKMGMTPFGTLVAFNAISGKKNKQDLLSYQPRAEYGIILGPSLHRTDHAYDVIYPKKGGTEAGWSRTSRNVFKAQPYRTTIFADLGHNKEYIPEDDELVIRLADRHDKDLLRRAAFAMDDTKEQRVKKLGIHRRVAERTIEKGHGSTGEVPRPIYGVYISAHSSSA
jgi:hypothetical protein